MGISAFFSNINSKRARKNRFVSASLPSYSNKAMNDSHNSQQLVDNYKSWVYICVSRNSTEMVKWPLRVYVAKPAKNTKTYFKTYPITKTSEARLRNDSAYDRFTKNVEVIEELKDHQINDIITNPNPFTTGYNMLYATNMFWDLTGDCYWYKYYGDSRLSIPTEYWVIPSQYMTVIADKKRFIAGYVYKNGTENIPFDTKEIVHFKTPDPANMYYGLSPLSAVASAYNLSVQYDEYDMAILENMGRPDGVLETEESLSDGDFENLKIEWHETYGGVNKAGSIALLENGVTFKPLSFKPRDMANLEGRKWTKSEIYEAYDNPSSMFDTQAKYSNALAGRMTYLDTAITPRHRRFEAQFNNSISPLYDNKVFVAFDSCIPKDREYELAAQVARVKNGITTPNEERAKINMLPHPDGDVLYIDRRNDLAGLDKDPNKNTTE
jgi:HK97 family phage portal protein